MTNKNVRNVQFHRTRFSPSLAPADGEPPKRHLKHNLNFPPAIHTMDYILTTAGYFLFISVYVGIGNIGEIDFGSISDSRLIVQTSEVWMTHSESFNR